LQQAGNSLYTSEPTTLIYTQYKIKENRKTQFSAVILILHLMQKFTGAGCDACVEIVKMKEWQL
jgi:hypothetical protein